MTEPRPRFYDELAEWWPLFSPPEHYAGEADDFLRRLPPITTPGRPTLLELGCGGGSLASHLKAHLDVFPRARWFDWFEGVGPSVQSDRDQWGRDVFVAKPLNSNAFR